MTETVSLKKNIIASYISHVYVILIGIFVIPLYVAELGIETYGLIGFFAILQALFSLLDFGLSPSLSRETSRFMGGGLDALSFRKIFKIVNGAFIVFAFVGSCLIFLFSEEIVSRWLTLSKLNADEAVYSLKVMAIAIAFKWMCGLYNGLIIGAEDIVWLSWFNVLTSSVRCFGIFPVMWFFSTSAKVFFTFQLLVRILEFFVLRLRVRIFLPTVEDKIIIDHRSITSLKPILKFSVGIAFTSAIWILVTNVDKMIVSSIVSLSDYGYFSLAITISSGILMISQPIATPITPRMTKLFAENKEEEMLNVYHQSSQFISIIIGTIAIVLYFFSKPLLFVWTGNPKIVSMVAPILEFYVLGYAFLSVAAMPFYLQVAMGKIKLHVLGNVFYVLAMLPILFFTIKNYGLIGAGYTWFSVNAFYFLVWSFFVHNLYFKGLHLRWLLNDIFKPIFFPILVAFFMSNFCQSGGRLSLFLWVALAGVILFSLALISGDYSRQRLFNILKKEA